VRSYLAQDIVSVYTSSQFETKRKCEKVKIGDSLRSWVLCRIQCKPKFIAVFWYESWLVILLSCCPDRDQGLDSIFTGLNPLVNQHTVNATFGLP